MPPKKPLSLSSIFANLNDHVTNLNNSKNNAQPLSASFFRQHDSIFQQIARQFQETSTKFMDAIGLNAEQRQQFSKMAQQQLEQKLQTFITWYNISK